MRFLCRIGLHQRDGSVFREDALGDNRPGSIVVKTILCVRCGR